MATYPSALSRNTRGTMLYTDAISAVWSWWDVIADPSYALREELDIWEIMQRDPKCYQGIQQRLNAIAGREWRVMPRGSSKSPRAKTKAAIIDAMLRRIPHFQDARRRLAQSVFKGQASELINGRREFLSLADQPSMHWFVCTGLKNVDPRRFVIRPIKEKRADGTTKVKGQLYVSVIPTYQAMPTQSGADKRERTMTGPVPEGKSKSDKQRDPLWYGRYVPVDNPEWFVRIVYEDEEARLGFGRGIQDAIYFFVWIKQIVLREGLQGLERFVHGVPILTLDPKLRGATDQASETIRDTALAKLKIMRAGHGYALNAGETLQWAEPGGTGNQMVMGFLEYIDRSLMAVITGSSLRSGGDQAVAGGYASDAVGMEVSDAVVQYDRDKIDEDLSLDLIGLLCKLNRPQFESLGKIIGQPGLADEPDPVFTTVVKRKTDPLVEMQIVQGASQVEGLDILKSEVYEAIGHSMPEKSEDVFKGGSAIQQPAATGPDGQPLPEGFPQPGEGDGQDADDDENFPDGPPEETLRFGGGAPEDDAGLFDGAAEPGVQYVGDELEPGADLEPNPEDELVEGPGEEPPIEETPGDEIDPDDRPDPDEVDPEDLPEVAHPADPAEFPGGTDETSGKSVAVADLRGTGAEDRRPTTDGSKIQSPGDVEQPEGDSGVGSGSAAVSIKRTPMPSAGAGAAPKAGASQSGSAPNPGGGVKSPSQVGQPDEGSGLGTGTARTSIKPQGPVPAGAKPRTPSAPGIKAPAASPGPERVAASQTAGKTTGPKYTADPSTHPITQDDARVTGTSKSPGMQNAVDKKKKGK